MHPVGRSSALPQVAPCSQAGAQPLFDCETGTGCEAGTSGGADCNVNDVRDVCDIICNGAPDCNANRVPDECDVMYATSTDVNGNGIPDECESVGDLNCDGVTDFADINPFVLFLSNFAAWQAEFPGCDPANGDINGDGTYGQWSFDDINPFVQLLAGG